MPGQAQAPEVPTGAQLPEVPLQPQVPKVPAGAQEAEVRADVRAVPAHTLSAISLCEKNNSCPRGAYSLVSK